MANLSYKRRGKIPNKDWGGNQLFHTLEVGG